MISLETDRLIIRFLDALSSGDLAKGPAQSTLRDDDGNRHNPIREFFIMAIHHQNYRRGQLRMVAKLNQRQRA